jgi:hypothetical protein
MMQDMMKAYLAAIAGAAGFSTWKLIQRYKRILGYNLRRRDSSDVHLRSYLRSSDHSPFRYSASRGSVRKHFWLDNHGSSL